jgi:hypothetical protein
MSSVLLAYRALRDQGLAHIQACDVRAHRFNLDRGTVSRIVNCALDGERRVA